MAPENNSLIPHEQVEGAGTLIFMRDFGASDNLNIANLETMQEVAEALEDFCAIGCSYAIDPPGFERGQGETEACLEQSNVAVWSAEADYQVGDVVTPAGGIVGLATKTCYRVRQEGTGAELGEPQVGDNYELTDCDCARPKVIPGDLEKDVSTIETSFSPGSDVTEYLSRECTDKRQVVVLWPQVVTVDANGQEVCKVPIWTWCGYMQKYKGQTISRTGVMKADIEFCRDSAVVKGCFVIPAAPQQVSAPADGNAGDE